MVLDFVEVIMLGYKMTVTVCGIAVSMVLGLLFTSHGHAKNATSNTTFASIHISHPPTSIIHHGDGSSTYEYEMDGGESIINLPPRDFNPLTASNLQLTKYGYPPRPTDKSEVKQWEQFVTHRIIQTPGNLVEYPNVRN